MCFQNSKNPKPLKDRLTWQQKQRSPQSNKVSNSVAVNARRSSEGVPHKRTFQNKWPRLEKDSCKRKPQSKKGSCNNFVVPSFIKFNEEFRYLASNSIKCFGLMHALS